MPRQLLSQPRLPVDHDRIGALCRRWHIVKLALFGSVLREDFGPQSDVDVLVQFESNHTPGWEVVDLVDELSELFGGRKVDLVNLRYLDRRLSPRILDSAVVEYEAPHAA